MKTLPLEPYPDKPFVGMAFKSVEDPYGQLTFTRVYQGKIEKGSMYYNQRTGKKERFSRILRMHADKREEIDSAQAGDIVAIMGVVTFVWIMVKLPWMFWKALDRLLRKPSTFYLVWSRGGDRISTPLPKE